MSRSLTSLVDGSAHGPKARSPLIPEEPHIFTVTGPQSFGWWKPGPPDKDGKPTEELVPGDETLLKRVMWNPKRLDLGIGWAPDAAPLPPRVEPVCSMRVCEGFESAKLTVRSDGTGWCPVGDHVTPLKRDVDQYRRSVWVASTAKPTRHWLPGPNGEMTPLA